jgi:hypothetical protein
MSLMKASKRMDTIVVSGFGHACKRITWITSDGFAGCDFRDNTVEIDSYFDEADMNS